MLEPEASNTQLDHGEDSRRILFLAHGDTATAFDLVKEPLDAIAFAAEHGAEASAPGAIGVGWNTC
jgi:hypothetical protein